MCRGRLNQRLTPSNLPRRTGYAGFQFMLAIPLPGDTFQQYNDMPQPE
jgi:hypothetical protein